MMRVIWSRRNVCMYVQRAEMRSYPLERNRVDRLFASLHPEGESPMAGVEEVARVKEVDREHREDDHHPI